MGRCDITERTETQALRAWHRAFVDAGIAGYDWRLEQVGDALCSVSSSDPSILVNRVLELGSDGPPGEEQLREIRRLYAESGVERFFLHMVPERKGPGTDAALTAAGYEKYRGWMKFVRAGGEVREANTDLDVRPVGMEYGAEFAAIAAPAFDILPVSEPVVALLPGVEGQQAFMSFEGDRPAGTGVIFIDGESAALDWGATHPDFRRRGGQTAVLSTRIRFGLEQGCSLICTMTGEAVPGDPQHSYSNIRKNGFEEAYLRENWVPIS
jgi:GNAT superfamily N-acetyltransferase